jgi:ABC-type dipeptide/oligopeptide/nickel transport system ATPase subunit
MQLYGFCNLLPDTHYRVKRTHRILKDHGHSLPTDERVIKGISFNIYKGETFALVGESGSGKSLAALSVIRLHPSQSTLQADSIQLAEIDILRTPEADLCTVRGQRVAMIFQDPMSSLNPVMSIGQQIAETIQLHLMLGMAKDLLIFSGFDNTPGLHDRDPVSHIRYQGKIALYCKSSATIRTSRYPGCIATHQRISAPIIRWPATAGDDRHRFIFSGFDNTPGLHDRDPVSHIRYQGKIMTDKP